MSVPVPFEVDRTKNKFSKTMTDLEKNIACAEECGWKDVEASSLIPKVAYGNSPNGRRIKIPNFSTDWNTRPIMWAAMTEKEIDSFCLTIVQEREHPLNVAFVCFVVDQPTFRDAFLKVKGRA